MSRFRPVLQNLALSLGATALAVVVLEAGARLMEKARPRPPVADYIWDWHEKMEGGEFYTIRSDANGWPPWEEINADGLRDRSHAKEKPAGRVRVAMLGDSVTLGDQIQPQDAYPQVLEALLRDAGRPVDVMNVGLWGWSTRQERIAYSRIVRGYRPDAVVLAVCLNDIPELQNNLARPPQWLAGLFQRSALVRRVVDAPGREIQSVEQLFTHAETPRVREAMARFFDEVRRLRTDVESDGTGFSLVVFPFRFQVTAKAPTPVVQQSILAFCEREKVRCLDLLPTLKPAGEAAFTDYDHLSPSGARLVAETLAASDLLPRSPSYPDVLKERLGGQPSRTRLVGALRDREALVRAAAAWALGREPPAADGATVQALVRSLTDETEAVRAEGARALGAVTKDAERAEAKTGLFAALRDPREQVRWAAAQALFRLGMRDPPDVPAATQVLANADPYVRGFAAFTLGEMGGGAKEAVPALVEALEREDGYGRGGASSALAKMGPAAAGAVPALVKGLDSGDPDRRWKAARTLGRIGPAAKPAAGRLAEALSKDPDERVRSNAARALGRVSPVEAAEALRRAANDSDPGVRREVAEALARAPR